VLKPNLLSSSAVLLASLCAGSSVAAADAARDDQAPDTAPWRANTGLVTGLGLALLLPSGGGDAGLGVELYGRYGIPAGPVILAPGALLGGYYLQHRFAGDLLGTFRVTLPLGPLAPFAQAGLGPGVRTNPSEGGLAWLGGGGLMLHLGEVLAVGVEVNYLAISGTGFKALTLGPSIVIGG
jgi:hypothetical protein